MFCHYLDFIVMKLKSRRTIWMVSSPQSLEAGNSSSLCVEVGDVVEGEVEPGEVADAGHDLVLMQGGHQSAQTNHRDDVAV